MAAELHLQGMDAGLCAAAMSGGMVGTVAWNFRAANMERTNRFEDVAHRNLLLLGLSQHGKSTFVNTLLAWQGGSTATGETEAEVGDGTSSCTKKPTLYRLYRDGAPTHILSYTRFPVPQSGFEGDEEGEALDSARRAYWRQRQRDMEFQANICMDEPVRIGRNLVLGENLGLQRQWTWGSLAGMAVAAPALIAAGPLVVGAAVGVAVAGVGVSVGHRVTLTKEALADDEAPTAGDEVRVGDEAPAGDEAPTGDEAPAGDEALAGDQAPTGAARVGDEGAGGVTRTGGAAPPGGAGRAIAGKGLPICVNILDTPGVEDAEGEDDQHVEHIIETVLELESLSGLAMVIKNGVPITKAWKAQVSRYWNLFPMMRAQWVFVHTAADPYALTNPQRRKSSSYETAMMQRVCVVEDAMKEVTGDTEFSAGHLWVESDVEDQECLKSYLAEQHNMLFTYVANFSPVAIPELPFQKGPDILAVDRAIISALDNTISAITATLLDVDQANGRLLELRNANEIERSSIQQQLNEMNSRLREIDNDGPVDSTKTVWKPWKFIGFSRDTVEIVTRHRNFTVSIIDTSGYWYQNLSKESEDALSLENGCKKLTITVSSRFLWSTMSGKIVVRSTNRDVHEVEVKEKRQFAELLKKQLADMRARHADAEKELEKDVEVAKESKLRHQTSQAMKAFLNCKWSVSMWRAMKPFYEKSKNCDGLELMKLFQSSWLQFMQDSDSELYFQPVDITKHSRFAT